MGKQKNKKGKFKAGTWVERELYTSRAYLSLKGFAPQLLILFLGKRDFKNKECVNEHNITMTYVELENIFNRGNRNPLNTKKDGITRPRIIRAINDLLAKGFIGIIRRGGKHQQDKTVYGLSDKWRFWHKGLVFEKRQKGNPWPVGQNKSDARKRYPYTRTETLPITTEEGGI